MKTTIFFPALLVALSLGIMGCSDATTRDDVADARDDLREEQQETAETVREGRQDIADARSDAQEHVVNRPVMDEDATEARQEVADAQQEAHDAIADQKQDERQAAAELRATEQQRQATVARDAFVKDAEQTLAQAEERINQLKTNAETAEGASKDAMNQHIEALENQHDRVENALGELKDADVAQWQAHQEPVRVALQELSQNMNNVR